MTPSVVLTIGGSDSAAGCGVQGDLRTLAALRVYGASVVTSVFARNTKGTQDVYPVPANVVSTQLNSVLDDLPVAAVKTGAFASPEACAAVAAKARVGGLPNLVVDPVLDDIGAARRAVARALERLLPYALIVTPNRDEASTLLGWQVTTYADMAGAASQLASKGPRFVVVTGGDFVAGDEAVDALWIEGSVRFLHAPRLTSRNTYGSGGTFAAAIAARLAVGYGAIDAVTYAKSFVSRAIADAADWELGSGGSGPMDHFGWSSLTIR